MTTVSIASKDSKGRDVVLTLSDKALTTEIQDTDKTTTVEVKVEPQPSKVLEATPSK